MDIGEFIEQDILIFLDDRLDTKPQGPTRADKAESTVFITKDYEKDMISALDQSNIPAAKQALHDLKEQLDTCPPGPDREHLKALLLSLYERFKDYLDAHHLSIDDPTLGLRSAPGVAQKESPKQATAQPAGSIEQVKELQQSVEQAIKEGQVGDAMRKYKEARNAANSLPAVPQDLALQFVTLFGRIKQMSVEHKITAIHKESAPAQQPAQLPTAPPSSLDHDLILQLEQEKKAMDTALHAADIGAAMAQYKKMRIIAQQISDPTLARQTAAKLQRIYEIISSMKDHSAHNEQQLAKVTP